MKSVRAIPWLVLAMTITTFAGVDPATASPCPHDLVTEKGHCAHRLAQHPLTASQKKARDERAAAYEETARESSQRSGARSQVVPKDPSPLPSKFVLPELEHMRIYREGEGNGNKKYTCGPSATRNVLAGLYKRRTGRYKDFGEAAIARWELTDRTGTARANIATGLNNNGPGFVYWQTVRPRYTTDYMNWIRSSTGRLGHAVIANVDTGYLTFFHGTSLMHFDFVYGYDLISTSTDRVRVGEEWSRDYKTDAGHPFNPYGKHWEPLKTAYLAMHSLPMHGIVA